MKKVVRTYGLISGGILAALAASMPYFAHCMEGGMSMESSALIGYSAMVLSFIMVFLGIRNYRDTQGGGSITFGKAFQVGLYIVLIACTMYVVTWEIVYYGFIPDFADKYAALTIKEMQSKGESAAAIAKATEEMARFKVWYRNPFLNAGMTYVEVFPVGLVMTLIAAAILRRRTSPSTLEKQPLVA